MSEVGIRYEHLAANAVRERFPDFEMASFGPPRLHKDPEFGTANEEPLTGGYFIPEAGYVSDPQLAAHNLQKAAEALGAVFKFNTEVVAINKSRDRVVGVNTSQGEAIKAAIVVNVAGPHSAKINALAGIEDDMAISTRPARHEVAHVPASTEHDTNHISCVVGDGDTGVYFRPETGNNLLIGSLDPECDARDYVDANDYNMALTEQWTNQVWRAALRIPTLSIPNTAQGVVGLYDATPDWTPIYDKSSLPGFYMAIGTSGYQFKNAPVIGDLMAELITACEAGHDHDNDPVRFYLPVMKRSINLGFFSRNRALHDEGSGTVLA